MPIMANTAATANSQFIMSLMRSNCSETGMPRVVIAYDRNRRTNRAQGNMG